MDKINGNPFAHIIPGIPTRPWRGKAMPKRILIIRLQATGDMVITLPYIQFLQRSLPNTRIDFLTREECASIPQSIQLFDNVYALGGERSYKKQLLYAMLLLPKLLLNRYDAVIDLQNNEVSRLITKVLRPKAWVQFDRFSQIPAGERNRLTIEALGLGPNYADNNFILKPGNHSIELLKQHGWNGVSDIVVVNPAGAFETCNWVLTNYVQFMKLWLQQRPQTQFLVMGVGEIAEKAAYFKNEMGTYLINLVNKTYPAQAFAIIQQAKFVLSEDSGLMHKAWVSGIPTLAMFGSTRSDWAQPLGEHTCFVHSSDLSCGNCMQQVCLHGDNRCITRYSAEFIFSKAGDLLTSSGLTGKFAAG